MAKNVSSMDIFGGMFQNIPAYEKAMHPDKAAATGSEQTEKEKLQEGKEDKVLVRRELLHPFHNHPFRVTEDAAMQELAESIRSYGIMEPILVRPDSKRQGEYEIIAGHRRNCAAGLAGLKEVPVRIEELDDDTASVLMVDSNNKREELLPSEKAWAFRIKAEALRHQGKRSDLFAEEGKGMATVGEKSGDSERTVRRYIRLTYLEKDLLDLVDAGKLNIGAGYTISFFNSEEQGYILDYYRGNNKLPVGVQLEELARYQRKGLLDAEAVERVMGAESTKRQIKENVTIKRDRLRKYFPKEATAEYMENIIMELLEQWAREHQNADE